MAELDIMNAFNDCVDRLAQGQSIDECLRRYPQYSSALRPMLEAGLLVKRIQVQPADVAAAQMRVRRRFEDALRAPPPRRTSPISKVVLALAAVLIVGFVSIGSLTALSQGSLPGDPLYGVKTFSEGLQQTLFDNDALEASLNQRRIQEVQQLLALGRSEQVTFNGTISSRNGTSWIIASLPVTVQPEVPNASAAHIGDEVQVMARTTNQRDIIAVSIQIVESAESPLPTATMSTVVPTVIVPTQTAPATIMPSATATMTSMATNTPQPTNTKVVSTPTPIRSTTVPITATTPQIAISTPTQCAPTRPDGWVNYQIRAGDTLSALAASTGISLTNLMSVNCITDAGRIVVGETIYLPKLPNITSTIPPTANSGSDTGSNNSGSGSSGSTSPTDDHGGDSDNSGHGGSGGNSGGSGGGSDDGSGHT